MAGVTMNERAERVCSKRMSKRTQRNINEKIKV